MIKCHHLIIHKNIKIVFVLFSNNRKKIFILQKKIYIIIIKINLEAIYLLIETIYFFYQT